MGITNKVMIMASNINTSRFISTSKNPSLHPSSGIALHETIRPNRITIQLHSISKSGCGIAVMCDPYLT